MSLGNPSIKDTPYNDRVALGLVPGVRSVHKYGKNPDIWVEADTDTANTAIAGGFDLKLYTV